MTLKLQIYKCKICGNIVQILQGGDGNLVCCGEEMELMNVKYDSSELGEKHTPKTEYKDNKRFVSVIGHPMSEEHYIQFIQTFNQGKTEVYTKFFKPFDTPEAEITFMSGEVNSVEYCNIHNLWGDNRMLENEFGNYNI